MPTHKIHRRGAVFMADPLANSSHMQKTARARLLNLAEDYDRRTKPKGARSGAIGHVGLEVLRALVNHFGRGKSVCWPSYRALAKRTGRCIDAIAGALRRLEAAGFIRVVRRKRTLRIGGANFIVQDTNVYSFQMIAAGVVNWIAPLIVQGGKVQAWARRVHAIADSVWREVNQSERLTHRKSPKMFGLIDVSA